MSIGDPDRDPSDVSPAHLVIRWENGPSITPHLFSIAQVLYPRRLPKTYNDFVSAHTGHQKPTEISRASYGRLCKLLFNVLVRTSTDVIFAVTGHKQWKVKGTDDC